MESHSLVTEPHEPRTDGASGWLSLTLTCILICELVGIVGYTLYSFRMATEPERLVASAESLLKQHYPHVRTELLEQLQSDAPLIADTASRELLETAPQARERLERFTLYHLERGLDNAAALSAEEFRDWLRENHDTIEDAFIQIENAPHDAKLLVLDTEASLEDQLGLDVRDQARMTLEAFRTVNDKLEKLTLKSDQLTTQEQLERRMIRLLRALGTGKQEDQIANLR